ncbi:hypothetical protein A9R05_27765 [Burkholderia sp. KK1]|nr:hypothetical protein A9R05_27765 [Burkholderia sp. KK1]
MRLFDEIVALLSDDKASLGSALLKTKVLVRRLGHPELDPWINSELTGYPNGVRVPEYRVVGARLTGTVENRAWRRTNVDLATMHLPDDLRETLCTAHMGQSVVELERFATAAEGTLASPVPPEICAILGQAYSGSHVTSAKSVIGTTQIAGVLTEIRSRLLDFILGLQDRLGDIPEEDMKKAAEGINAAEMFRNTVIGANATIIIGNHNHTTVTNVAKGDMRTLHQALADAGVSKADLEALDSAIGEDGETAQQTGRFGPRVAAWIGSMVQKAATGGWNVAIGAAGNLLATAIGHYYGQPGLPG